MSTRLANYLLLIFSLNGFLLSFSEAKNWALLIAGSKDWINYRHQADLLHAYQLLRKQGIPQENIVTMFYDDIASHPKNPDKGVIINVPGGPNVYEGVVKDYTKNDLTVANFLNVLKGDKQAMKGIGSGRVIESGPEDKLLVYIVDHGSPGSVTINEDYLYADQLNDALKYLKDNKRYSKALIFVETCESGSMFDSLLDDRSSIYVMTAAAPDESSFVRYYSDKLDTYIGDAFSTIWMEKVESIISKGNPTYFTLFKMYDYVRSNVNLSHVMMYGDFRLGFDPVTAYLTEMKQQNGLNLKQIKSTPRLAAAQEEWVDSREVQPELITLKLRKTTDATEKAALKKQLEQIEDTRTSVDTIVDRILLAIDPKLYLYCSVTRNIPRKTDFPCYRQVVKDFNDQCFDSRKHTYVTKHFYKFLNLCVKNVATSKIADAFKSVCKDSPFKSVQKQNFRLL